MHWLPTWLEPLVSIKSMTKLLTKKTLSVAKNTLHPDWELEKSTTLSRKFIFKTYLDGFMFVTKIAIHASVQKNYPIIILAPDTVTVQLVGTENKSLAVADFSLAKTIDDMYQLSTTKRKSG